MKNKKNYFLPIIFTFVFILLAACSNDSSDTEADAEADTAEDKYTIKLANDKPEDHHYNVTAEKLAETVSEETDGNVEIEIYPSSQLGSLKEVAEGVQLGTQDMVLISNDVLENWVPDAGITSLPYLFDDYDEVYEALDGEVGDILKEKTSEQDFIVLGWWVNGFRNLTNSKQPILEPDDAKGLKLRVMESDLQIAIFEELGTLPTPMASSELYTGLQQGTVDAQESSLSQIYSDKYYEVQDYLSLDRHTYSVEPLLINKDLYEGLPEEYQNILMDTATELQKFQVDTVREEEDQILDKLKEEGMTVDEVDVELFKEATQPVYEKLKDNYDEELYEKVMELTE